MNSFKTIEIEKNRFKATIFLNRPEVHNALNNLTIAELKQAFQILEEDKEVRIIVLTGHGRSFCAGADLNYMKEAANFTHEQNLQDAQALADLFDTIAFSSKPVIGLVNGAAIGGGAGIVAACDILIAVEKAKFAFSEINLGIIPAVISPHVLPKIGVANARQFFITGARFSATEAKEMGLISYIVKTEEDLWKKANELIEDILTSAPQAISEAKQLIRNVSRANSHEEVKKYTVNKIADLRASKEGKEGITAFLEKRKPFWYPKNE
ncbi:MAG: enoyl-CoA hydratase-related protein [Promethearchaeota archaeon]